MSSSPSIDLLLAWETASATESLKLARTITALMMAQALRTTSKGMDLKWEVTRHPKSPRLRPGLPPPELVLVCLRLSQAPSDGSCEGEAIGPVTMHLLLQEPLFG